MPMDRSKYPDDWEEISYRIRFERAGGCCEWCGVEHGEFFDTDSDALVVLTTAHLDHDPMNCIDSNLAALCQRCYLSYDSEEHRKHAAETRRRKLIEAGQLAFAGMEV